MSADKTVNPGLLSMNYTVEPLLTTLIGGLGTLTGPVVATLGLELTHLSARRDIHARHAVVRVGDDLADAVDGGFALFFYVFRRGLRRVVTQVVGSAPRLGRGGRAGDRCALVIVALVAQAIHAETDPDATVYKVADLWQLFQGLMFVVAVMLLPHGIVGTWNRWWYARRLRREERAAAALAARCAPAPAARWLRSSGRASGLNSAGYSAGRAILARFFCAYPDRRGSGGHPRSASF